MKFSDVGALTRLGYALVGTMMAMGVLQGERGKDEEGMVDDE